MSDLLMKTARGARWVALAALVTVASSVPAVELKGKVTAVDDQGVTITLDEELQPNSGDRVTIRYVTPDGLEIPVGTWRVTRVDGNQVVAAVVEATGQVNVEMEATVFCDNPRRPQSQVVDHGQSEDIATGGGVVVWDLDALTPPQPQPGLIPSLGATVTGVKFFESGYDAPAKAQRVYETRFSGSSGRYVNWELNLEHPEPGRKIDFTIEATWFKPDGSFMATQAKQTYITADWSSSYHSFGWGWGEPGNWPPGTYTVELSVDGSKIATETFEIAPVSDLTGEWVCKKNCPAGGEGKTARIVQTGSSLHFTNEGGGVSSGRFEGASTVIATDWGNLRGTVTNGGNAIAWANGTIWERR